MELRGAGAAPATPADAAVDDAPSPGAPSDAEVRTELRKARAALTSFREYLNTTAFLPTGPARPRAAGRHRRGAGRRPRHRQARDPRRQRDRQVPLQVGRRARRLARQRLRLLGLGVVRPGGRRAAQPAAHLGPVHRATATEGPGDWITIYANAGHVFMVVAGLRFDTSGQGRAGTRWQEAPRTAARLRGAPHRRPLAAVGRRLAPAPARHGASGGGSAPGCEFADREPRAPLDVGHERRAELGVGRAAPRRRRRRRSVHPAAPLRLGEARPRCLASMCG